MMAAEQQFPVGSLVWHRSFKRHGHVCGYTETRGREQLLVKVSPRGDDFAGMDVPSTAWTANSCKFIRRCPVVASRIFWDEQVIPQVKPVEVRPDFAFRLESRPFLGLATTERAAEIIREADKIAQVERNHAAKKLKDPMDQLMQLPKALAAVAKVLAWAEQNKGYDFQSFLKLDAKELRAACMRHTFLTGKDGENTDDESDMLHAVHGAANALMLVEKLLA